MQNKLVENWLTSVKELSFTAPFVQLLTTEGYTVLQSKGGVVEQGKDIIAKDKDGNIHCFQLKCGNIGSSEWQSINGQLNDLTGIVPIHPNIVKSPQKWKCYLVTNGEITGPVLRTIKDYSETNTNNGRMPLETISKDELLQRFTASFGTFLPIEPNDIRIFFELYCEEGDNALNRKDYKQYLERFLSSYDTHKSKQKKLEVIQAVPILSSYLLTNKYLKNNHTALIDAWTLTCLTILYYANRWSLDLKKYASLENLVLEELDRLSMLFIDDIATDEISFFDTTYGVFSEPIIAHQLRCGAISGYMSAAINYSTIAKRNLPGGSTDFMNKITLAIQKRKMVSEADIPFFINSILASSLGDEVDASVFELQTLVDGILLTHKDDGKGLISPYYSTEEAVAQLFGSSNAIEEDFHNRSYMLWSAVLLLAKYGQREFLNERWVAISEISMEEIVAHDQNDLLLWNAQASDMMDTFPNAEQSWEELVGYAKMSYDNEIPSILLSRKYLIPFMLLAMPHRLTPKLVLSLVNSA